MTTVTTNTTFASNSTANLRLWAKEVSDALAAAGLVLHTDTGQIDFTTVTWTAANTVSGYQIWKFSDALQATKPIYIKLEYGTNNSNGPQMWITVGIGTNGAGLITGSNLVLARTTTCDDSSGAPPAPAKRMDVCCIAANGYVLVHYKRASRAGNFPNCWGFWAVWRSTDDNGDPSSVGVNRMYMPVNSTTGFLYDAYNFDNAASPLGSTNEQTSLIPWNLTFTQYLGVPANPQKFKVYQVMPKPTVCPYFCTYVNTEVADGIEAGVSMVGSAAYTFQFTGADASRATAFRRSDVSFGYAFQ